MPRTYTQLLSHVVFSTKERRPALTPKLRAKLFPYMTGIIQQLGGIARLINGVADHVHILLSLPATAAPSEFIGKLKANSSKWVHESFPEHRDFAWQLGYSAFSVSFSQKQGVLDYIAGQEEHHAQKSFQEDLIAFLKKHAIEYDERYVFL